MATLEELRNAYGDFFRSDTHVDRIVTAIDDYHAQTQRRSHEFSKRNGGKGDSEVDTSVMGWGCPRLK